MGVADGSGSPSDTGPSFRLWPPVSVGVPLVLGLVLSATAGDPLDGSALKTWSGWLLVAAFAGLERLGAGDDGGPPHRAAAR